MNDYARATGRSARRDQDQPAEIVDIPLSEAEMREAEKAKAFVCTYLRCALPLIKALVDEGMMPGWRGVKNCRLLDIGKGAQ